MSYWPDEDNNQPLEQNRRTGPDYTSKFLRFSSFLSWMLLIITALIADAANPSEFNIYVLDRKWNKSSAVYFRENYIYASLAFAIVTFIFIVTSLILESRRQKRKTDHYSYSLIIALILDFLGLIGFAVYFLT